MPTDPPAAPPVERAVLDTDVPCAGCGYDLRGIDRRGRCPECGLDVGLSLAARAGVAPPVDAAWRRHMIEAAAVSLASFVLLAAAASVPQKRWLTTPFLLVSHVSRGYQLVTVLIAAAWGLEAFAAYKIGRRPALEPRRFTSSAGVWLLWGLAAAHLFLPVSAAMAPSLEILHPWLVQVFVYYSGPLACLAFYLRVAGVFRRFGAAALAAQARIIALLMPLVVGRPVSPARGSGLLDLLGGFANYQHAHPSTLAFLLRDVMPSPAYLSWEDALPAAVPLCGTYLIVRLLVVAVRARPAPVVP